MQVNQVQNLLLANAPQDVRARAQAGEEAQQRAAAPSAPYTSRMAGLAKMLEGGLGGLMEGSAIQQVMHGRQEAAAGGYGWLNSLQPGAAGAGSAAAPPPNAAPSSAPMGQGGIGSDHVAGRGPDDYLGRLGQIESGNRDGISNKASGATGRYQFIGSTWDRLSKQYPELGLTPDGRTDPAQQQRAIQAFTNDNASALGRSGFQATPGNLYLAHFAGANGAAAALKADPNTPVEQVIGGAAVRANPFLHGKTAGDLVAWANGKMAGVDPNTTPGSIPSPAAAASPSPNAHTPAAARAPAVGSAPIGDAVALAAETRLRTGGGTDADRALLATYRQQQNTPPATRAASADVPATNAHPVGSDTLPPGITPDMVGLDGRPTAAAPVSDGTVRGDLLAAAARHGMTEAKPGQPQNSAGALGQDIVNGSSGSAGLAPGGATNPPGSDGTLRGDLMQAAAQHGLNPDAPAPNATPTGMQGLPPGVSPAMFAASQGLGADLHRQDEVPAGTQPYTPGAVTAGGVPHQVAPGGGARADSGVGAGIGGGPSNMPIPGPDADPSPELDPEGTGPQNYDPNAGPSLRDMLTAAVKGPDLGKTQAAVVPDPVSASAPDAPPSPSILPPARPPSGDVAGPAAVPAPQGALTPPPAPAPQDGSLRGDLMAAMSQHDPVGAAQIQGRDVALDPVVPDPQGSMVPPAPSSPNDALVGPQSDAAAGGADLGMDGPAAAPQAALPDVAPMPPPGVQSLQAPADVQAAAQAAAVPELDPEATGPTAYPSNGGPTLRDQIAAAFHGSAAPTAPQSDAAAPLAPQSDAAAPLAPQSDAAAPLAPAAGPVDIDQAKGPAPVAALGATPDTPAPVAGPAAPPTAGDGMTPSSAALVQGAASYQPSSGNGGPGSGAALPTAGPMPPQRPMMLADALDGSSAGSSASSPQPGGGGGGADLSKLAMGPLTPHYMSGLAAALSPPPATASGASQARSPLADALDASKPAPNAVPAGPVPASPALADMLSPPMQPSTGINHDGGGDTSSPQAFMRQEAARAQGGAQPSGFIGSLNTMFSPGAPSAGQGGGQTPQQGTPAQARTIASQIQGDPNASPASQSMAGRVMSATGGQGGQGSPGGGSAPAYVSPAMAPAPSSAPAASGPAGFGGMTPEQRQAGLALLTGPNAAYMDPAVKEAITARLFAQPKVEKLDNGDLYQIDPTGASPPRLLAHGGKYEATKNGLIYNQGTGLGVDGQPLGGASTYRPATPAERAQYHVTDDRPMYFGPGGQPDFGQPGAAGQGESEEAKKAGGAAADRRNDMLTGAMAAPEKIARLKLLGTVLDNTQTGPLAGETGTVASVATRLGVAPERLASMGLDPNQAVNNAIANKLAGEMTMGSIGAKNGGMPASNFSVAERQFIEALYPNIENQAGGNRAVTDVLTAVEQRKMQVADAWSDYKDQQAQAGKPLSYETFEDGFRRAHSQDNIFAPIIAKYQAGGYTPTAPTPGGVPNAAAAGQSQGGSPSIAQQPAPQPQGQGGGGYMPGAPRGAPPPAQGGGGPGMPPRNVAPGVTGAPQQQGQGAPTPSDAIAQAQAAIAHGAPRAAVMQRLQGMGISTAGL
ncbi:hypothetical protein D3273_23370 [Lichenibacterium minor]|uniref:Uncharacterized protein n=1 Tax=Lichenibacterium minor TaxID=2316528 RepID=A0A4Q2U0D5_9HYPH|nr:hypothetical protein [Lichenibacterium minor]RYC29530.1 hypothetical protein D3273_23370 [Lichenibacterium minor]